MVQRTGNEINFAVLIAENSADVTTMSKPKEEHKMNETEQLPSRRSFFTLIWIGLGFVAFIEFIGIVTAFILPRKKKAKTGHFGAIIDVGPVDKFPKESVTAFIRGKFYLCRLKDGGFLAVSRQCTHLGCTVPWSDKEKKFICPCHASAFDITGEVISPPAPRALDIYHLYIENSIVKVDTGRRVKRSGFHTGQVVYNKKA
jgi:nitrite reductase/ring-hydroxylating ferredoxin subunit